MAPKLNGLKFCSDVKEYVVRKRLGGGEFAYVYRQGKISVLGKKNIQDILDYEGVMDKLKEGVINKDAIAQMSDEEFEKEIRKAVSKTDFVSETDTEWQNLTELDEQQIAEKYKDIIKERSEEIIFEEEVINKPNNEFDKEENETKHDDDKSTTEDQPTRDHDDIENMSDDDMDMGTGIDYEDLDDISNKSEEGNADMNTVELVESEVEEESAVEIEENFSEAEESRVLYIENFPKEVRFPDVKTFFSHYAAEECRKMAKGTGAESAPSYFVIFKTKEDAESFHSLSPVEFENSEIRALPLHQYNILKMLQRDAVESKERLRTLYLIHNFIRTKLKLISESASDTNIVLISGIPKNTTDLQVRTFSFDQSSRIKDLSRILRCEMVQPGRRNSFTGEYLFLFSNEDSAAEFCATRHLFDGHVLSSVQFGTLGKVLDTHGKPLDILDEEEEMETNKEQRVVVMNLDTKTDSLNGFVEKLKKTMKATRSIHLCPLSLLLQTFKFVVTFKNVMAARKCSKNWEKNSEVIQSDLKLLPLGDYVNIRSFLLRSTPSEVPRHLDRDEVNIEDEVILIKKFVQQTRSVSCQANLEEKKSLGVLDRASNKVLFNDVVVCEFPRKYGQLPNVKEMLDYLRGNHPAVRRHMEIDDLHLLRFESSSSASEFLGLSYVRYKGERVKRKAPQDCHLFQQSLQSEEIKRISSFLYESNRPKNWHRMSPFKNKRKRTNSGDGKRKSIF